MCHLQVIRADASLIAGHRLGKEEFRPRFAPLRSDVAELVDAPNPKRVRAIQHALIDLIDLLDPKSRPFPDRRTRTKFSTADRQPETTTSTATKFAHEA